MGFGDKFKDLAKQAQEAVAEHKEQISGAVERASVVADERTGGKYADKIAKVSQKAGQVVEKLGGDQAAGEPPVSGQESTAATADGPSVAEEPATAPEPGAAAAEAPDAAEPPHAAETPHAAGPPHAAPKPAADTSEFPDFR